MLEKSKKQITLKKSPKSWESVKKCVIYNHMYFKNSSDRQKTFFGRIKKNVFDIEW
jgi:hypothetical protein